VRDRLEGVLHAEERAGRARIRGKAAAAQVLPKRRAEALTLSRDLSRELLASLTSMYGQGHLRW